MFEGRARWIIFGLEGDAVTGIVRSVMISRLL